MVGGLPPELAAKTARRAVAAKCGRLAELGWTPAALAEWARAEDWVGAWSGRLVSSRLADLGSPPQRPATHRWCGQCDHGWLGEDPATGHPIKCPRCKPTQETA